MTEYKDLLNEYSKLILTNNEIYAKINACCIKNDLKPKYVRIILFLCEVSKTVFMII